MRMHCQGERVSSGGDKGTHEVFVGHVSHPNAVIASYLLFVENGVKYKAGKKS